MSAQIISLDERRRCSLLRHSVRIANDARKGADMSPHCAIRTLVAFECKRQGLTANQREAVTRIAIKSYDDGASMSSVLRVARENARSLAFLALDVTRVIRHDSDPKGAA